MLTSTRPSAVSVSVVENSGVGVSGALNVALLSVTLMNVESKLERPWWSEAGHKISADCRLPCSRSWTGTHRVGVLHERIQADEAGRRGRDELSTGCRKGESFSVW